MASSCGTATDGSEDDFDNTDSCGRRQRRERERRLTKATRGPRKGLEPEAGWGHVGTELAKPQSQPR